MFKKHFKDALHGNVGKKLKLVTQIYAVLFLPILLLMIPMLLYSLMIVWVPFIGILMCAIMLYALIFALVGIILQILPLYAFGELVDRVIRIHEKLDRSEQ